MSPAASPWAGEPSPGSPPSFFLQKCAFLPIVFTTLGGIGPPEAVHYLDTLFSDSYASELAASGSTRNTAHARRLFYQSLLATLTNATADMTSALTIAAFDASTADALSAANALSDSYLSTLTHFTSLRGIDAHAASLIILICLRPHSRFNHHLRGLPHLLFSSTSRPPHPSRPLPPRRLPPRLRRRRPP